MQLPFDWNRIFFTALSRGVITLISLVSLAGCKFAGVDYEPPQVDLPDAWNARIVSSQGGLLAVDKWWERFEDETLDALVAA